MDELDRLRLLAELDESHCELNHGPGTKPEEYPASDYIVLPVGYQEDRVREVSARELVVPVCLECAQALLQDEWTLLYCFECGGSRWVCRKLARNAYRHHILWLRGCPDCTNVFGGLYFTDIPQVIGHVELLSQHVMVAA